MVEGKITPQNCVHFDTSTGKTIAQRNVTAILGRRAEALIHIYNSSNEIKQSNRDRAARGFKAIAGFHPQVLLDYISSINGF